MADETTQQQTIVAQPMQPVLNIDSKTHVLKDEEIYSKMMPLSQNARDYTSEKMAGEQFYLYKFKGAAITVNPEFHQAFQDYQLVEVTLTGTMGQRTVPDPNVAGGRKIIDSQAYTVDGCVTVATKLKMLKLKEAKKMYERAEKTINKMDVSKELTEAELKELLDEA